MASKDQGNNKNHHQKSSLMPSNSSCGSLFLEASKSLARIKQFGSNSHDGSSQSTQARPKLKSMVIDPKSAQNRDQEFFLYSRKYFGPSWFQETPTNESADVVKQAWRNFCLPIDLCFGVEVDGRVKPGFETYCPPLLGRQLGFIQQIPSPPHFSRNKCCHIRPSVLEKAFFARCHENAEKQRQEADFIIPPFLYEATPNFVTWWSEIWRKIGGEDVFHIASRLHFPAGDAFAPPKRDANKMAKQVIQKRAAPSHEKDSSEPSASKKKKAILKSDGFSSGDLMEVSHPDPGSQSVPPQKNTNEPLDVASSPCSPNVSLDHVTYVDQGDVPSSSTGLALEMAASFLLEDNFSLGDIGFSVQTGVDKKKSAKSSILYLCRASLDDL